MAASRLARGGRFRSKAISTRLLAGLSPARRLFGRMRIGRQHGKLGLRLLDLTGDLAGHPADRIEEVVGDPLLERDDAVVGDVNALGAHLAASLGDVAE